MRLSRMLVRSALVRSTHFAVLAVFVLGIVPVPLAAQFIPPAKPIVSPSAAPLSDEAQIAETLRLAYRYGFPLVATDRMSKVAYGEVHNAFYLQAGGASAKDAAIPGYNNETMYAGAWFDLKNEALVLQVPPMGDRFFAMPVCDAWNNVVRVIGTRTTGNAGGKYLLAGPFWKGKVPKGIELIRLPTNIGMLATRIMVKDNEDRIKNGFPIMDKLFMTPLAKWPGGPANPNQDDRIRRLEIGPKTAYTNIIKQMPVEEYFNRLNQLLIDNPGYSYDRSLLARLAKLGIGPGLHFDLSKFSPAVQLSISDYARNSIPHEQLKVATIGMEPDMRKLQGRFGTDYDLRYYISVMGLGAQLPEDGIYVFMTSDTNSLTLNGNNRYLIHLDKGQTPKVGWSWSFTTYDKLFNLIPNLPLDRHVLTMRSPLQYNADGSIDLYVQADSPGGDRESNWLPVPRDGFFIIMRLYWADQTIVDGLWPDPVLKRMQ